MCVCVWRKETSETLRERTSTFSIHVFSLSVMSDSLWHHDRSKTGGSLWSCLQIRICKVEIEELDKNPGRWTGLLWGMKHPAWICPNFSSCVTSWLHEWLTGTQSALFFLWLGNVGGDRVITGHYPTLLAWGEIVFSQIRHIHIKEHSVRDWSRSGLWTLAPS